MKNALWEHLKKKKQTFCSDAMKEYPEETEEIIMKWAKEHPVKTNADKFKEVFGINVDNGNDTKCYGLICPRKACDDCEFNGFWDREYIEPQGE